MYNHDATSGVPFVTHATENRLALRSCRWYQIGCQLENAFKGMANGLLFMLYNGNNDQLIAYHSSIGFRLRNSLPAITSCHPDSPASPLGWGVPFFGQLDRDVYYWANHTAFHWQPPGQNFQCRRGLLQVPHAQGWAPIQRFPRLP